MVEKENISDIQLFKEIEKKSWIFVICCVTIAAILGKISIGFGVLVGAFITLYNFRFHYTSFEKLLDKTSSEEENGVVDVSLSPHYFVVGLVAYFSIVILKVNIWGLVGGLVLPIGMIVYCSISWFAKEGFISNG